MNPKLRGQVAHIVDGKAVHDRPDYWHLVKFAVEKEAEINFDKAKKASKPKATTHFQFDRKKSNLPVNPTVWMVAPAPEEEVTIEETTPQPSEDSDSGKSYEAQPDDMPVSTGDIKIAVRVAHTSEAFSGRCFRCNKVGHHFWDEVCEMYDLDFLNSGRGPAKTSPTGPQSEEHTQADQSQDELVGDVYPKPNVSNLIEEDEGAGKKAYQPMELMLLLSPRDQKSPLLQTFLPGRSIMQCHLYS